MVQMVSVRGVAGGATIAASPEVWSFSHWWVPVDGTEDPDQTTLNAIVNDVYDVTKDYLDDDDMALQANVHLTECRVYLYSDTTVVNDPSETPHISLALKIAYSTGKTPLTGRYSSYMPLQITTAVSMSSEPLNRPVHRGRFYLPPRAQAPAADGLITVTEATNVLGATSTYLDAVNDIYGDHTSQDYELAIVRRQYPNGSSGGGPLARWPVRQLRVGRVLDTQRRRRNALAENYVSATYGI